VGNRALWNSVSQPCNTENLSVQKRKKGPVDETEDNTGGHDLIVAGGCDGKNIVITKLSTVTTRLKRKRRFLDWSRVV
jgi:hypothetical protein